MKKVIKKQEQMYALVTAAYNEEKHIERTIQSIVAQTVAPQKWIIVSDGSTDRTDELVRNYAAQYSFIELFRIMEDHARNFTSQVNAINTGFSGLKHMECNFIGNLDSDITLEPTYFESVLARFAQDSNLGLAGGFIYEREGGKFRSRPSNSVTSVAHAIQLFRRECLEALGGYKPLSWGGSDTHAEVSLRMKGWRVESFPELKVFHHRPTGKSFGSMRYQYRGGLMDFYLGTHPAFEILRMIRRLRSKPYVVAPLVRFAGFAWAYFSGRKREVSSEFIRFFRKEQMRRLRLILNWRSPRWGLRPMPMGTNADLHTAGTDLPHSQNFFK